MKNKKFMKGNPRIPSLMVSCPFGAISDKSQIFQLAHALREGNEIFSKFSGSVRFPVKLQFWNA